jgi:biopolymer transport protein ExbD
MDTPASSPAMNTTPLIDVMLVLLILFIMTVPIATHTTSLNLPGKPTETARPRVLFVEVDFDGRIFWDGREVSTASLDQRFAQVGRSPDTLVHVRPDRRARFQPVVTVLAAAQRAHVDRLSLASIPE